MKQLIFLLMVFFYLPSCSKTEIHEVDGEEYTVIPVDSSSNYLIEGQGFSGVVFNQQNRPHGDVFTFRMLGRSTKEEKTTSFTPSNEEIIKAEEILKRCVEIDRIGADSLEIWDGAIKELSFYNRQYFGGINQKGQKLIWINSFKKGDNFYSDWKTEEVSVDDGGDWYFNIVTNLDTEQCYGFFRNSIGG